MDSVPTDSDIATSLEERTGISSMPLHRYRIQFADGSVGTRRYDQPLTVGERVDDSATGGYVVISIEREPEHGSVGRATAHPAS